MPNKKPLKIMFRSPVGYAESDPIFAAMAEEHKLPGTEVHITSLPASEGGFTHIEYRSYEAMVTRGTSAQRGRLRARGSTRWRLAVSTTRRCTMRARCRKA
ncbi:hypothetical protein [Mesorhizobium sp. IMUNJ 23232]|uniref:hypothetical protein n=1 Tax=Mesorhizobium sp. IMUNJ 23232 TaxID=3376064 RepID=UPI0037AD2A22